LANKLLANKTDTPLTDKAGRKNKGKLEYPLVGMGGPARGD